MKTMIAATFGLVTLGAGLASATPMDDSQALMHQFVTANRALRAMAEGQSPFDAEAAKAQLQVLVDGSAKLPALFPATAANGGMVKVKPAIFTDTAGFKQASNKMAVDATAAQGAHDAAGFATAYKAVESNCGSCHAAYADLPPRS